MFYFRSFLPFSHLSRYSFLSSRYMCDFIQLNIDTTDDDSSVEPISKRNQLLQKQFNSKKLTTAERKERNRIRRKQKKLERKLEYLDQLEYPKAYNHAGKRCITPYWHTFHCNIRHRWVGKTIINTLLDEFPACTSEFMYDSIRNGRLKLNGVIVNENDIHQPLKLTDKIEHKVHRHEPPVLSQSLELLDNMDDNPKLGIYAVNKPPSIPVHPCGAYHFNSILRMIVIPPLNLPHSIQPVHRLDKLTSGVVVFADGPVKCSQVVSQITSKNITKSYIALVNGIFGSIGETIIVEQPLWSDPAGRKMGRIDYEDGKYAKTIIKILEQKNNKTLVQCNPITGRTHQIRIHLQYLGYPIIGDPLYQIQNPNEEELNQFKYMKKVNKETDPNDPNQSFNSPDYVFEKDSICMRCNEPLLDQPMERMYMCLHSIYYKGDGWCYYAKPPFWSDEILSSHEIYDLIINNNEQIAKE